MPNFPPHPDKHNLPLVHVDGQLAHTSPRLSPGPPPSKGTHPSSPEEPSQPRLETGPELQDPPRPPVGGPLPLPTLPSGIPTPRDYTFVPSGTLPITVSPGRTPLPSRSASKGGSLPPIPRTSAYQLSHKRPLITHRALS